MLREGMRMETVKVLIVDDEPLMLRKLRSFRLAEHGFDIAAEAENGQEALALIERLQPDIVVADIGMPVMDGLELLKLVNRLSFPPKVVLLTCYEDFDKAQTALRCGAHDYVTKLLLQEEDFLRILRAAADSLHRERSEVGRIVRYHLQELVTHPSEESLVALGEAGFKPDKFALSVVRVGGVAHERLAATQRQLECTSGAYRSLLLRLPPTGGWCLAMFSLIGNHTTAFHHWCSMQTDNMLGVISVGGEERGWVAARGPIRYQMADLSACCADLIELCDVGFFEPPGALLHAEQPRDRAFASFPPDQWRAIQGRIVESMEASNRAGAAKAIVEWAEAVEGKVRPHPAEVKDMAKAIVSLLADAPLPEAGEPLAAIAVALRDRIESAPHVLAATAVVRDAARQLEQAAGGRSAAMRAEIQTAIDYMQRRYQDVQLAEAARHVSLSPSWFASLFRSETGQSFHEYLQSFRMQTAKRLLLATDRKVYEIAMEVGIPNARYFSRLFTEQFGLSPLDCRKQHASSRAKQA